MGGFFGAASKNDCITDVFFGTDYHSHLGTRRGGMTSFSEDNGFQRSIHSIENSPFRTKFEDDVVNMRGKLCIGCISDTDPPLWFAQSWVSTPFAPSVSSETPTLSSMSFFRTDALISRR